MAASISTLKAMLVLDTSKWNAGFVQAGKEAQGFAKSVVSQASSIITAGGIGTAIVATFTESFSKLKGSFERVAGLGTTAKKIGATTEGLQELSFAASKSGIDIDTLANGLLMMGKNIGSGGKSLDRRFLDVADAFTQISDAGERAAFAKQVFGKGGFEFINLLAKGSTGIRQSADAIEKFSLAIKDIDAKNAKEALLAGRELGEVLGTLKDKIAVQTAPAFRSFFKTLLSDMETVANAWKTTVTFMDRFKPKFLGDVKGPGEGTLNNVLNLLVPGLGTNRAALKALFGPKDEKAAELKLPELRDLSAAGALGSLSGKKFANPLQFGTSEAMSAITNAGGQKSFETALKPVVDKLTLIERHEAAAARTVTRTPLRPSNLRGGGSR